MKQYCIFSEWATEWLQRKSTFIKESTLAAYTNIVVTHLLPNFGAVQLALINEEQLQEYALKLLKEGRLDGNGGLSSRGAKSIVIVMQNILHDAMKAKLIPREELNVKFPSGRDENKVKVFSKIDQQKIFQAVCLDLSPMSAGILLALLTGLRIGEVCGLKWVNIDLNNAMLHVNQTLQRVYAHRLDGTGQSHILIGPPKTRSSRRDVPISSILMPVMKRLSQDNANAFFLSGTEKAVEVRTFRSFFTNFLKKNDIEPINFHALRHTFASRCIEAGADCKTVSEILGHSAVTMTLNLYVHPQLEQKRKCVELLTSWN